MKNMLSCLEIVTKSCMKMSKVLKVVFSIKVVSYKMFVWYD